MRTVIVIGWMMISLAALASTQVPTSGNVFFGYSYYNTNLIGAGRANLNGWEGSLEGKVFPGVGIVADFSGDYGSQNFVNPGATCALGAVCPNTINPHVHQALFGPRFSASFGRVRPFAEFEFGVAHVSTGIPGSDSGFATAVGGGLDYRIIRPVAWRLQGDYVSTHLFSAYENNVRLSTGIVARF
jgi:hypothetical protein